MLTAQSKVYVCSSSGEFGSSTSGVRSVLLRTLRRLVGAENVYESPLMKARTKKKQTCGRKVHNLMSRCDCVVCLVGCQFGGEPATWPANETRRSYAQLEYDLARCLGKRLIRCVADRSLHNQSDGDTPAEEMQNAGLQTAFRDEARRGDFDYLEFATPGQLRYELSSLFNTETAQHAPPRRPSPVGQICTGSEHWITRIRDALVAATGGGAASGLEQARIRQLWDLMVSQLPEHPAADLPAEVGEYRALVCGPHHGESLPQRLAELEAAIVLNLDDQDDSPFETILSESVEWIRIHPEYFLVLKNRDPHFAQQIVVELLADLVAGNVVLTQPIHDLPADVKPIDLALLVPREASAYVLEGTQSRPIHTDTDAGTANGLVSALDGVAQSIELAVACINTAGVSLADYFQRWQYQQRHVSKADVLPGVCCPKSFITTLRTTFTALSDRAQHLLRFSAALEDASIPQLLLESQAVATWLLQETTHTTVQNEPLKVDGSGTEECEEAVAELLQYGLLHPEVITCEGNECRPARVVRAVRLHHLARQWVRHCQAAIDPVSVLSAILEILPVDPFDHHSWPLWELVRPHATSILAALDPTDNSKLEQNSLPPALPRMQSREGTELSDQLLPGLTNLTRQLGQYLHGSGEYTAAEPLLERALELQRQLTGSDSQETAEALEHLAGLYLANGRPTLAEEHARQALRIKESRFHARHRTLANPLHLLGEVLQERGQYVEAEKYLRQALTIRESQGPGNELDVAESLSGLASLLLDQAHFHESEALYRQSLMIHRDRLPSSHPLIAEGLDSIAWALQRRGNYDEAGRLLRESLQLREWAYGSMHPLVSASLNNLALLLADRGARDEAEPLYRRSLRIKEKQLQPLHPDRAANLDNLAGLLRLQQKHTEAETLFQQALEIRETTLGPAHPDVSITLNNYGLLLVEQGRFSEAEAFYRRSLSIKERALSSSHLDCATTLENLAHLLRVRKHYGEAESLFRRALQIREVTGKSHHLDTATTLNNLAVLYDNQDRLDEAERLYLQSLQIKRSTPSTPYADIAITLENLGRLLQRQQRLNESQQYFREALQVRESAKGSQHPEVAEDVFHIASILDERGEYAEAEAWYRKALRIQETAQPVPTLALATTCAQLAELLRTAKRYPESERLFHRALFLRVAVLGADHVEVATTYNNLAVLLVDRGKLAEAEALYRRCIAIKEQVQPIDGLDLAITVNNLAHLVFAQNQYAEAEALYWRVLQLREPLWGGDHVDALPTLNRLATLSFQRGNYRQAESVITRVLRITQQAFGARDPRMAAPLSILARVLQVQYRFEEAKAAMKRFASVVDQLPAHEQLALADVIQHSADMLGEIGQTAAAARLATQLALARQRN